MPGTLVGELLEEAVGLEDRAGDPEYVAYVDTDRTTVALVPGKVVDRRFECSVEVDPHQFTA